jgi:hypothetical protein
MSTDKNTIDIAVVKAQLDNITKLLEKSTEKMERWHEIYATKQELNNSVDDLRQEFYKDLAVRREMTDSRLVKLEKLMETFNGWTSKKKKDQSVTIGLSGAFAAFLVVVTQILVTVAENSFNINLPITP